MSEIEWQMENEFSREKVVQCDPSAALLTRWSIITEKNTRARTHTGTQDIQSNGLLGAIFSNIAFLSTISLKRSGQRVKD